MQRFKPGRPSWWIFYLEWSPMIGLLMLDYWTPMSNHRHEALAIAILLSCYTLVARWLYANRSALRREDEEKRAQRNIAGRRQVTKTPVQTH
jgi:hypothetical protein